MTGNLKFSWEGFTFVIPVKSKYTIIQGDSGIGKTFSLFVYEHSDVNVNANVRVATNNSIIDFINADGHRVIIMDEDHVTKITTSLADEMNKSDKQFILICRRIPATLPVDYRDIYTMRRSNKYHFCERVYPDFNTFTEAYSYLCEDSRSGYLYLNNRYKNVRSAGGNSNLSKQMCDGDTVFGDGAAIGVYIRELCELASIKYKVNLYLPISFEYLVCRYLHKDLNEEIEWWRYYASAERYYTDLCEKLCGDVGIHYSKTNLPREILKMRLLPDTLGDRVAHLHIDGAESIIPYLPASAAEFNDDELRELILSLL